MQVAPPLPRTDDALERAWSVVMPEGVAHRAHLVEHVLSLRPGPLERAARSLRISPRLAATREREALRDLEHRASLPESAAVRDLAEALRDRLGDACLLTVASAALRDLLPRSESDVARRLILLHLAGGYRLRGRVLLCADGVRGLEDCIARRYPESYSTSELRTLLLRFGIDGHLHDQVVGGLPLRYIAGVWAPWPEAMADRCAAVLTATSEPWALEDLRVTIASSTTAERVERVLASDGRFYRTITGDWYLTSRLPSLPPVPADPPPMRREGDERRVEHCAARDGG